VLVVRRECDQCENRDVCNALREFVNQLVDFFLKRMCQWCDASNSLREFVNQLVDFAPNVSIINV
jgi:hypothetical protein